MIICLILMVIIFIKFCVSFPTNIVRVSKANPRRSTGIYLILVLGYLYINRADLWDRLFETNPYRFWYQVIRKNPQPSNVSLQEYAARNKAGYCWRDKKFYSKDELKQKALKSLAERMIFVNQFYWDNKAIFGQGDDIGTEYHCIKNKACKVIKFSIDLTQEESSNMLYEGIKNKSWEELINLADKNSLREYVSTSDKAFINDEFDTKNFFLISKDVYGDYVSLYSSEQAIILNKLEWLTLRKKYAEQHLLGIELESEYEGKYNYSLPPQSIDLNSWGVGNYYLGVTNIVYGSKSVLFLPIEKLYADKIYILNNCGDILYLPYYYKKKNEQVGYNS